MNPPKSGIPKLESRRIPWRALGLGLAVFLVLLSATEVLARVGGGQSYGGGRSGGSGGDGGGAGALIYLLIRFLIWLTFEHPLIGIPVDIIVIGAVVYWFTRRTKQEIRVTPAVMQPDSVSTAMQ